MNTIRIAGKDYPCMMTMGAMLRFKQQMGYEVTAMKGEAFTDTLTLLWCCVASACAREKVPFAYGDGRRHHAGGLRGMAERQLRGRAG